MSRVALSTAWLAILFASSFSRADVVVAPLFSDGAVLQRDKPVAIWGTADPGETVTVSFHGQTVHASADATGRWSTHLPARSATPTGADLVVSGKNTITLRDIVVGEVWLCAGQSNMEWPVERSQNAPTEIAAANFPIIRHIKTKRAVEDSPQTSVATTGWQQATPENAGTFTAIGYFCAREIHQQLGVPVGLVHSAWGGTPIEAWSSREALSSRPEFQPVHDRWAQWLAGHPKRMSDYGRSITEYELAKATAAAQGDAALREFTDANPPPRRPPPGPGSQDTPSGLFNAMLAPLIPYGIRGVLWYQGEANVPRAAEYHDLFATLITDWRAKFQQGDFPFYWVQLANFDDPRDATGYGWALLREAQTQTLTLPNTAQAVIIDIGDNGNIHPANKQDVGHRLATIALARIHGIPARDTGPIYAGVTRDGHRLRVAFNYADQGLIARDGPVLEFEIAGADRVFHPANGEISGGVLIVSSPAVPEPVAVRYAFKNALEVNLFSTDGLPVAPFRSDDW